ncbi:hypothetical protein GCM10009676_06940 [Prauserella halophila]|uniref:HTH marR-type domain-containing protein n=1 Tax=Prauserella halophila TaxID=185641 RepID=A0ABP4GJX4_9PSEU|nr:MarR family transcriptional regulator [Prauserella halophila]MCP2237254.1 DNA-binding transcriptional regulator, MarR family [Prauserella halophila]
MDSFGDEREQWLAVMPPVAPEVEAARQRIGRVSRLLARVLDRVAAEQGITVGDWETLSAVKRAGGSATPTFIAERLSLTSGTVSVRLRRMVAAGLLTQRPKQADGDARSRPIELTPHGERVWRQATERRVAVEHDYFAAIGQTGLAALNSALADVLAELEQDFGIPSPHDASR